MRKGRKEGGGDESADGRKQRRRRHRLETMSIPLLMMMWSKGIEKVV
jgi:hypothetical protein